MSLSPIQLDALNPQNLLVMQAYDVRAAAARIASDQYDGWLDRIDSLPNMTSEQLTQLHGQLIALGFLKFEIAGRSVGLRYQISNRGRQILEKALAERATSSDDVEDHEGCDLVEAA